MTKTSELAAEIKRRLKLTDHLAGKGFRVTENKHPRTNLCPVAMHRKGHLCVSIDTEKQLWHCNDHEIGGSIIDWIMAERGKTMEQAVIEVGTELGLVESEEEKRPVSARPSIVATYDYTDPNGNLLFQVVRYAPKEFRQRRPDREGGWIWNMEGINRVPYHLPEVLTAETVVITEGEKDADNIRSCGFGFTATCNVRGAGKWLDAYSEFVSGKNIVVIPDNDDPGRKHAEAIIKSLDEKVNWLKLVQVPAPYKDASDWLDSIEPSARACSLRDLIERTPHTLKPLPVFTMAELEAQYVEFARSVETRTFDLARFIPSLGRSVRRLMPGELVVVMSDTGVGKTAIQQCLARSAAPLPTLFFELELPQELMFERFVQMETAWTSEHVEAHYLTQCGLWRTFEHLNHILVCAESGLSTVQIESFIGRSELKTGTKPAVVIIDYIGLIRGEASRSR